MHNRARLIVASFLTKDLHLDWRRGEAHFMRHLLCGDEAQNNGNWQWITSVGVDPAPYFRRMYNPVTQQRRHDPDGEYVRHWCPELRDVPLERLAEPWTMSGAEQEAAGCVIGRDYPEPIVDHKRERERAMERYRAFAGGSGIVPPPMAELYLQRDQPAGRTAAGADRRADAARRAGGELLVPAPSGRLRVDRARVHGRRVVDLACGEGYGSAVLGRTAASVVGVDANPEAFEHAR